MLNHEVYMIEALKQASLAYQNNEVPIGAVVVFEGKVIGEGSNRRQTSHEIHAHAEIEAMNMAAKHLKSWNLEGCTLYVTVEPCPMCAGAIVQSHLSTVVYGASEPNSGSFGSVINMHEVESFNHKVNVVGNVLANEASNLMKDFFKFKRETSVKIKKADEESFKKALKLRMEVFVDEQGVPEDEEIDDYDVLGREDVTHVVAMKLSKVVGTARYIKYSGKYKIGRVAVRVENRGEKIGSKLLSYIEKQALNNGIQSLELGAQITAIPFYEQLGYKTYGEIFDDAGIDHIMMEKKL